MKNPPFTLPLSEFVILFLGDSHNKPITSFAAEQIQAILDTNKDCFSCKIEWPHSRYNPDLETPVLWQYARWVESTERWEIAHRRSEIERNERFVLSHNIYKLSLQIIKYCCWSTARDSDKKEANEIAYRWVKSGRLDAINHVGWVMITSVDEIK